MIEVAPVCVALAKESGSNSKRYFPGVLACRGAEPRWKKMRRNPHSPTSEIHDLQAFFRVLPVGQT
nr:MAG TPA: hypothetical protein [Caudoviricetes sp.]